MNTTQATTTEAADNLETFRLERDGDRDLEFRGHLLGEGDTRGHQRTRGTKVRVYRTEAGKIITAATQWSCWEGESTRYEAVVHESAESALEWLTNDHGLGDAQLEAWEQACDGDAELAAYETEKVA